MKLVENWEPFMTRNQAVAMAEELSAKGMSQANIAVKLADAGFANAKTNKPVSAATICMMLKKKKRKPRTLLVRPERVAQPTMKRCSLDAIRSILKLKGMAADERIALALLVLE